MGAGPRSRARCFARIVCGAIAVLSCGKEATGGSGDLSDAEVAQFIAALSTVNGFGFTVPGLSADDASFAASVDRSIPCPRGGGIVREGVEYVSATGGQSVSYSANVDETHSACSVVSPSGQIFLVNTIATPIRVNVSGSRTAVGGLESVVTRVGAFRWVTRERASTCTVNVQLAVTAPAGAVVSQRLTGTLCGRDVDQAL